MGGTSAHERLVSLHYFPFTAIVEQERLKQALLLNAVNPAVGGVLIKGPSGTGKSTAVRGLAELLPEIDGRRRLSVLLRPGAAGLLVVPRPREGGACRSSAAGAASSICR